MGVNKLIIEDHDLGQIHYRDSKKARRVSIQVLESGKVQVVVPHNISLKTAAQFVDEKRNWIRKHQEKLRRQFNSRILIDDKGLEIGKARALLSERLDHWSSSLNYPYRGVSFRRQKTRWGSCSSKGHISLNLKISLLPSNLINYVIIHELVHTEFHNHGTQFWARMDEILGDAKQLQKELRQYRLQ